MNKAQRKYNRLMVKIGRLLLKQESLEDFIRWTETKIRKLEKTENKVFWSHFWGDASSREYRVIKNELSIARKALEGAKRTHGAVTLRVDVLHDYRMKLSREMRINRYFQTTYSAGAKVAHDFARF